MNHTADSPAKYQRHCIVNHTADSPVKYQRHCIVNHTADFQTPRHTDTWTIKTDHFTRSTALWLSGLHGPEVRNPRGEREIRGSLPTFPRSLDTDHLKLDLLWLPCKAL